MTKLESIDAIVQKTGEWYNAGLHSEHEIKLFIGDCLQEAYQQGKNHGMIDGTKFSWTS